MPPTAEETVVNAPPPPADVRGESVAQAIASARAAQQAWAEADLADRIKAVLACRRNLVDEPEEWAQEITVEGKRSLADSLAAEVLPTADACRFLERNAARLLRGERAPARDRPIWGRGLRVRVRRAPIGVVVVIGAGNYPLFLAGVQALQAITAGNAVLIKPAPGASAPMRRLVRVLEAAGAPAGLVQVLDEAPSAAEHAIDLGADHVVLTGSAETGRKVYARAAERLTPCTMELSGCDAVFVLDGVANLEKVADAIVFGLRLNAGATCIGPRRVFATAGVANRLSWTLRERLLKPGPGVRVPPTVAEQAQRLVEQAIDDGAEPLGGPPTYDADDFWPIVLRAPSVDTPLLKADLFAPVVSFVEVADMDEALRLDRACPYALGASVFGPLRDAAAFAERIEAGCVTVNDLVAPTADPRVAFGGCNQSGFGVTRGAEGLRQMTRPQTIVTQTSAWLPHLDPPREKLDRLVLGLLRMSHGRGVATKWRGLRDVVAGARSRFTTNRDTKDTKG
ncbi:MAG: aldehyde dehydrogenase family protein [Planctomycetota bacterium]